MIKAVHQHNIEMLIGGVHQHTLRGEQGERDVPFWLTEVLSQKWSVLVGTINHVTMTTGNTSSECVLLTRRLKRDGSLFKAKMLTRDCRARGAYSQSCY